MGFTDVAWESRSTEQLARDLTEGPGPRSVGQAGAAWVRVANELASVSEEYDKIVDKIKASFASKGADAAVGKIEEFGRWLQAVSLSAAGNGERAEEAAVANGVAVMAMPNVSEAVEDRTAHDVMDSLAAYNGAILNGRFAELDEAATGKQAAAAAIMYQYEESCNTFAAPWDQPVPPDVCNGAALESERHAKEAGDGSGSGGARGAGRRHPESRVRPARQRNGDRLHRHRHAGRQRIKGLRGFHARGGRKMGTRAESGKYSSAMRATNTAPSLITGSHHDDTI